MTHVLEIFDGDDSTCREFKTLAGAVNAGVRELKKRGHSVTGYQAANRFEGQGLRRHIVAEWKDRDKQLARVWT